MRLRLLQLAGWFAILLFWFSAPFTTLAQVTGGNTGGTGTTIPGFPSTGGGTGGNITGGTSGGSTGIPQATQGENAQPIDLGEFVSQFNIAPETAPIESMRLQPFVGPSRENFVTQNLAHPRSQIAPSASSSSSSSSRTSGNRGQNRSGSSTTGFEVARAGLRTRLVPVFQANRPQQYDEAISVNFDSRLNRLPNAAAFAGDVNMVVNGRQAILTGNVSSIEDRDRAERLARLEPGIYRIDNQITVSNQ
jgi:hypothetical protein